MIDIMMIVVSVGDGCRGFEDVIMDEVKEDLFHRHFCQNYLNAVHIDLKGD